VTGTRRLTIVGAIVLRTSPGTFRGRPPRKAVEAAGIARATGGDARGPAGAAFAAARGRRAHVHATGFAVFDMLTSVDEVRGGADTAARPA